MDKDLAGAEVREVHGAYEVRGQHAFELTRSGGCRRRGAGGEVRKSGWLLACFNEKAHGFGVECYVY